MEEDELLDEGQKKFIIKHWKVTIIAVVSFVGAAIVALAVILWVVANAQLSGLVPSMIGEWTVGYFFTFILNLIFWELAFVGSWFILIVAALFFWYKKLPEEDRAAWPQRGRREESDAFGFFVMLAWLLITYIEGRWDLAFQAWSLDVWVYSFVAAFLWVALIAGIPIAIYFIYWIIQEISNKEVLAKPTEEVTE